MTDRSPPERVAVIDGPAASLTAQIVRILGGAPDEIGMQRRHYAHVADTHGLDPFRHHPWGAPKMNRAMRRRQAR